MMSPQHGHRVAKNVAMLALVLSTLVSPSAAFTLYADPLVHGLLGAWSSFSFIFLACVVLSIICVTLASTAGRRTPFALLIPASLFLLIMALSQTALTVMYNSDASAPVRAYVALDGMQSIALFWALALVFLAIAFVANERYERAEDSVMGYASGKKHPLRMWGYVMFFIVFGMGTSAGALWAWYLDLAFTASAGARHKVFRPVAHATGAVFTASGLFAIAQAVITYKKMDHIGVSDRATKVLTFLLAPAYFCASAATLSYYLVMHIIIDWEVEPFNRVSLIFCVLINFFVSVAVAGLLVMGLRRGDWYVWGGGSEIGKLSPGPFGSTPKLNGHITDAFVQPFQPQPQTQSIYSAASSPQPNVQPQNGADGRPLTYFSTTTTGSNVRPDTTYTYVGEVDSMLRRTAYGQALQQQPLAGSSPPPQTGGSPQPIPPQQTGSSQPSVQAQAQYQQHEQFQPQQMRYGQY